METFLRLLFRLAWCGGFAALAWLVGGIFHNPRVRVVMVIAYALGIVHGALKDWAKTGKLGWPFSRP